MKINNWIWTEKAESKIPSRKAGMLVPKGFLMEGCNEYYPYKSWVDKGYVKRRNEK